MLQRIRYHRARGANKYFYGCIGHTLLKPKALKPWMLDIREEHLAFLRGRRPTTTMEKRIHALLIHENTHSERQFQSWVWWFQLRYIFSRSFRLREEQVAYAAEIRQLVRYQLTVRRAAVAKAMSGPAYRMFFQRMVGYDEALHWVREAVRAAEIEFFAECMASRESSIDWTELATVPPEKIEVTRPVSAIKDRVALVCTALVGFVVLELIVLGVGLLSGAL